jgi:hypothetical protein
MFWWAALFFLFTSSTKQNKLSKTTFNGECCAARD